MILTFSDKEECIIEKIMAMLTNDDVLQPIDTIPVRKELCFGNLKIIPSQRKVMLNDGEVSLTTREFDVLIFLASHNGQVFTIRQIYAGITDEPFVETYKSLESCLYRLRKKIGNSMILNVRGYGYKFNGE